MLTPEDAAQRLRADIAEASAELEGTTGAAREDLSEQLNTLHARLNQFEESTP